MWIIRIHGCGRPYWILDEATSTAEPRHAKRFATPDEAREFARKVRETAINMTWSIEQPDDV